jgi:hypothetical protein
MSVANKEWSEFTIQPSALTYTEFVYLLAAGIGFAAPIADGTNGKKWIAALADSGASTLKTLTIEQGSSIRAEKAAYGHLTSLSYSISRDAVEVSAAGAAQRITDGITMTASPTEIALKPVSPATVDIYLDTAHGALGTTKLLNVISFEYTMADRLGQMWPVNSANSSFGYIVERRSINSMVKIAAVADAEGMAFLAQWRAGTTKFLRVKALGDAIAGGTPSQYTFQHDMAVQVARLTDKKLDDDAVLVEFELVIVGDSGWGKAQEFTVINELAAL